MHKSSVILFSRFIYRQRGNWNTPNIMVSKKKLNDKIRNDKYGKIQVGSLKQLLR